MLRACGCGVLWARRCSEYERAVARLQERLEDALQEAQAAREQQADTLPSPSAAPGCMQRQALVVHGGGRGAGAGAPGHVDRGHALRQSLQVLLAQLAGEEEEERKEAARVVAPRGGSSAEGRAVAGAGAPKGRLSLAEALHLVEATCARKQVGGDVLSGPR